MGRRISNSRSRLADLQSGGLLGQADAAPSHATMKRLLTELGMDVAFTTSADFTTPCGWPVQSGHGGAIIGSLGGIMTWAEVARRLSAARNYWLGRYHRVRGTARGSGLGW